MGRVHNINPHIRLTEGGQTNKSTDHDMVTAGTYVIPHEIVQHHNCTQRNRYIYGDVELLVKVPNNEPSFKRANNFT